MKLIKTLLTILVISLLSSPSWSETIDDLETWGGIFYQKVTLVPFTGKLTGSEQGSIKNGKREDTWVGYYENGQLWYKGDYNDSVEKSKNGEKDGAWVHYWKNGQLRIKNNYKNDKLEGACVVYHGDGTVWLKFTGTFKDGVKISN